MIYFDNAATGGKKPPSVVSAACAAIRGACANPGRSGHKLSVALASNVLNCRRLLSDFFGAPSFERVILTKNCTEALNIALFGLANSFSDEHIPHIVTTEAEHNSVLRPLFALERNKKISLTVAKLNDRKEISPENIAAAVREDTAAVAVTLASNVTGTAADLAKIRKLIPERVLLICDGAQACGHVPLHMKNQGIDALAAAGHKGMHGIQGSGFLLLSDRFDPAPFLYGGTGSESMNPDMPDFYPDRLEGGTLSYPAAVSLFEGALYLKRTMDENAKYLKDLTAKLISGLSSIEGITAYSRPNPYGIAAFSSDKMQSEFFAQELSDDYDIAVRGGLHCAPLMHRALGTAEGGLVRASLSEFNTPHEVEKFLDAAKKIQAFS